MVRDPIAEEGDEPGDREGCERSPVSEARPRHPGCDRLPFSATKVAGSVRHSWWREPATKLADFLHRKSHLGVAKFPLGSNEENVSMRRSTGLWLAVALFSAAVLAAADSGPKIGRGATRQEVIDALGQPIGHANFGSVEILHYRNGQVRLENGRVERHNLRPVTAAPSPAAQSATSSPSPAPTTPISAAPAAVTKDAKHPLSDVWMTQLEEALRDATRRNSAILALFTQSDGSPTSRQFQKEITYHPEFVNAFRAHYVLLLVDDSTDVPESAGRNLPVREQLGVHANPALLILSATGEKIAAVEITDAIPGSTYRSRLIAAVTAAYALPMPATAQSEPKSATPAVEPGAMVPLAASPHIFTPPPEVAAGLTSARWFVMGALCVGILLSGAMLFVLWLVLRKLNKPAAFTRRSSIASRIDHAASGLPSHSDILSWPREMLCDVIARLAEMENFETDKQARGSDYDLILRRTGESAPEAIVCCVSGNAGVIPTRRIRELVGMMATTRVSSGWFVSPMGFSLDARAYAEEQNIRLIDGSRLLTLLGDLPTFALPKVLASIR